MADFKFCFCSLYETFSNFPGTMNEKTVSGPHIPNGMGDSKLFGVLLIVSLELPGKKEKCCD